MSEELLKQISRKLSKKADKTLTFSSTSSDFTTQLYPPLQLEEGKWVAGLVNLETYYSFVNIDNSNNNLKYSTDSGTTWKTVKLPPGCYELAQINSEVKRLMDPDRGIEISPNTVTLGSIVDIKDSNYKVDFTGENSLASILGFNPVTLEYGYNVSQNIVNIMNVNSILVNCDIISNSYLNGSQSPVLYSFFPNVRPGAKIVKEPTTITYLPLNRSFIQSIRIWITDQDGRPLDFR